jgi:hypothetical protein
MIGNKRQIIAAVKKRPGKARFFQGSGLKGR